MMSQFRISGHPDELAAVDIALADLIEPSADWLTADERMAARLGLHELLVNVTRHAYPGCEGEIDIVVAVTLDSLAINVLDGGVAWAASLQREFPDQPATSGYGIPIILAAYDDVRYCRSVNHNHWALRIYRRRRARFRK